MKKYVLPLVVIFSLITSTVAFAAGLFNLPTYPVTAQYGPWTAGANSTMDVTLSGVGAGFDITDGVYAAWCIQDHVLGSANHVTLYSSDDPNMPADAQNLPWDKINYLLNHKQGDKFDIQTAIWLLLGEQNPDWGISAIAAAMVQDANANGVGFVPQPGQAIAVILYSDGLHFDPDSIQEVIIELEVPGDTCTDCGNQPGTGTPGYWKTHPEAWPVDSITIGGVTYTKAQAIAFMDMPDGDKTSTIFRALVSAKLNVLIGNEDSCVASTIVAADAWMAAYGPVGSKVKASSAAWKLGEPLYLTLDSYNNGLLCAPHRN